MSSNKSQVDKPTLTNLAEEIRALNRIDNGLRLLGDPPPKIGRRLVDGVIIEGPET